jgi:HEPN domain-containing protein
MTISADIPHRDALLNDFARRSFRDVGDHDYIAARLSYRHRLIDQFLWSGQQSVEKYLKCILLMNRIRAPRVGHDLDAALQKLNTGLPFELKLTAPARKFLAHLDRYGRYRYFETSPYVMDNDLHLLDLLVWEVRRYCTPLNYSLPIGGENKKMLEPELRRIESLSKGPPHKLTIMDGELEKILKDKAHPARAALVYKNFRFGGRSRKRLSMRTFTSGKNSPLLLHPEILDVVGEYVYISKGIYKAYKPLMEEALDKIRSRASQAASGGGFQDASG